MAQVHIAQLVQQQQTNKKKPASYRPIILNAYAMPDEESDCCDEHGHKREHVRENDRAMRHFE